MGTIINAIPGEVYTITDVDTLVIIHRRLTESDIKRQLSQYNDIFVKQTGAGIPDITNSMIAYVRVKVLLESGVDTFDGKVYRELFKECKNQITRINNIIRLTKTSALTAEEYQKDRIAATLKKNEAFIVCLEAEMASIEKKLDRLPKVEEEETNPIQTKEVTKIPQEKKEGFLERLEKKVNARKEKKEIGEFLRNEEKKQAKTCCEEIPYYDRNLVFTVSMVCKDIPAYTLLRRKNNIYFGLSKNVGKSNYDNSDGTLVELTKASEEFLQFMTEDLLGGEYTLNPFSEQEKEGMEMYFDFVTRCFEVHIGVTLTVREYLNFKVYYNQLVSMMFDLERQQKEDYYKALILADRYQCYMRCYGLEYTDSRDKAIEHILSECNENYISDIELILNNHIVDSGAKDDLEQLKEEIEHFHMKVEIADASVAVCEPVKVLPQVMQQEIPHEITQNNYMQIVIQLLDGKREVVDEALYAGDNIRQALFDFERKDACIKRLGFRNNGVDIFYKEEVSR
ncbi:hypothetical protein [Parasporobacterium paucivorans]|nr:hypothetical protein [Parasporobacterium paucivorans]